MNRDEELEAAIVAKYAVVAPVLNERARRLWAAAELIFIGYGGDSVVSAATGISRVTIAAVAARSKAESRPRHGCAESVRDGRASRRRTRE